MAKHLSSETPVIVINNNQNKRRNPLVWLMTLAVVAVVGIGGTYAYFTYTTNAVENDLSTVTVGVTADVIETNWTDAEKANATNMVPGKVAQKNPVVVNTSKSGLAEYVGMKITFEKSTDGTNYEAFTADDMTHFKAIYALTDAATDSTTAAGFSFNTSWTEMTDQNTANSLYFYYNSSIDAMSAAATSDSDIAASNKTAALFSYVRLVDSATEEQIKDFGISNWRITVSGAAIQKDAFNSAADYGDANWKSLLDKDAATADKTGWRA